MSAFRRAIISAALCALASRGVMAQPVCPSSMPSELCAALKKLSPNRNAPPPPCPPGTDEAICAQSQAFSKRFITPPPGAEKEVVMLSGGHTVLMSDCYPNCSALMNVAQLISAGWRSKETLRRDGYVVVDIPYVDHNQNPEVMGNGVSQYFCPPQSYGMCRPLR